MRVDLYSDYMCPFCYIAETRFKQALSAFEGRDDVEVTLRSFQLGPHAKTAYDVDFLDFYQEFNKLPREDAMVNVNRMKRLAAETGLEYNMDHITAANSFDAHRMTHFAMNHGKGLEFTDVVFRSFLTDRKNIADPAVLADAAEEVGLNRAEALAVANGDEYAKAVHADQSRAAWLGVTSVPYFIYDGSFGIGGAKSVGEYTAALKRALRMEQEQEQAEQRIMADWKDPEKIIARAGVAADPTELLGAGYGQGGGRYGETGTQHIRPQYTWNEKEGEDGTSSPDPKIRR